MEKEEKDEGDNPRTAQWQIDSACICRWSMSLQRGILPGWMASADYTGSRAVHMWNQYEPTLKRTRRRS